MDQIVGLFIGLAVTAALILAVPISMMMLWSRTRRLRERVETLEQEVHELRRAREVREAPRVPEVPRVPEMREAPRAPDVREVPPAPARPARPLSVPPPPAVAAPAYVAAAEAPVASREPESLETTIGSKWLLYIGIVAIVIGVAYFEKLAIDYGWITATARVVQGAVAGLALMFVGTRFIKRRYTGYGQILMGGGGAILYLSTYAAFNFYALIGRPTAFALMIAITALIAWLADRERSQALAVFAVGGGFVTPFLLPGTTDAQVPLFTYDVILIAGTAALSRRRDWPILNLVSYAFTLLTVAGWAIRFYEPEKYLRTEVYLTVYCAMFLYIQQECRRKDSDAANIAAGLLWTAPILYYAASLVVLFPHDSALLVWLVALMLAGGIAASRIAAGAGFVTWLAAVMPLVVWCATRDARAMRQEGLVALAAIYVIALLAELESTVFRDERREIGLADVFWVHLNPLAIYAGAYLLISPESLVNAGYLAAAFALWNGVVAATIWKLRDELAIHFAAVGFTLTAIAIALIFSGAAITAAWAVEGAVMIALALRQRRDWLRVAGGALFAVAAGQTLAMLTAPAPASHVIFLNSRAACAGLIIALSYGLAWLDWRGPEIPQRELGMGAALLTAQFMTLALLTSEANAYWAIHEGNLERQLTLSVVWGLYATGLIVIGLARDYAPVRYFAMAVLAITIGKVFFVDMAELDRIYRVGSVIVLGILLLVTSYQYSRARKSIDDLNGR